MLSLSAVRAHFSFPGMSAFLASLRMLSEHVHDETDNDEEDESKKLVNKVTGFLRHLFNDFPPAVLAARYLMERRAAPVMPARTSRYILAR